jgi:hypothetical protein
MGKSFRALLVEQDQEYTYYVRSIRNIHQSDVMDFIRLSLLPYDLREIKKGTYVPPLANDENGFINEPWSGVYTITVVLGTSIPNQTAVEKIALFTHINNEYIIVHQKGESSKQLDNSDDDEDVSDSEDYKTLVQNAKDWGATSDNPTSPDEAQKLAGNKRLGDFFKELEQDRKEREEDISQHNVEPVLTESFVTSHTALKEVTGQSRLKGFYLVERFKRNDSILHINGPFKNLPDSHVFLPEMTSSGGGTLEVINEKSLRLIDSDRDFRFTHIVELAAPIPREVTVLDQDTGKEYHVIVKSMDETDARSKAITQVANKYKLDSQKLLADDPESAQG